MKTEIPKLDTVHLSVALGVLYVFGFIVANVHFGRYELPRIELLRARYLAASLLFVLCSTIPFGVGAFLSRSLRTEASGEGGLQFGLKLGQTEAWAIGRGFFGTILIALGMHELLVSILIIRYDSALFKGVLYFIQVVFVTWFMFDAFTGGEASEEAHLWPSVRIVRRVLFCLFAIVIPATFSLFLYGSIKPELGGGAMWKGRLSFTNSADSSIRAISSRVVTIVGQDEQTISLLACQPSGPPIRISVPASDVSRIQLGARVEASTFLQNYARECRRLDMEQKPVGRLKANPQIPASPMNRDTSKNGRVLRDSQ
jgi:hypothetical protein